MSDRLWTEYAGVFRLMQDIPFVRAQRARLLAVMPASGLVLDAGCGAGLFLEDLARESRPARRLLGLDTNATMLRLAAAHLGVRPGLSLVAGRVEQLPLASRTVDGYLSNNVLMFTDDPLTTFAEMARVTRPGGHLALSSARPASSLDPLIREATRYAHEHLDVVRAEDLARLEQNNRALWPSARHRFEPNQVAEMLAASGQWDVLESSTAYLEQNFFVRARRR